MIRGAKAVILDPEDNMLILYRSGTHPYVPHTADLPGGKVEDSETMVEGLVREVKEETGIELTYDQPKLISSHKEASYYGRDYYLELYEVKLADQSKVTLSYEHDKYGWQPRGDAKITGRLYSALLEAYKEACIV